MPVIITPVTSPADAKPVQKNSESTPTDDIPVQSGAAATPADAIPAQKTAQTTPVDAIPSQKNTEATPADVAPVQSNTAATPADAIPVHRSAASTPADAAPVQSAAQATPADATPSQIGTTTIPAVAGIAGADGALGFHSSRPAAKVSQPDALPVERSAKATPVDEAPSQKAPEATPADAIPSQSAPLESPADAFPSEKTTQATPDDAVPVQKSTQATPADSVPSQSSTVASPADAIPVQRSAESTPDDAVPSQSAPATTPVAAVPVQISTTTTPAVSGLAGVDGALGFHSSRPVPKAEPSVIPFTHPRICYQSYLDTGVVTVSSGDITAAKSKLTYDKWQPSGSTEWVQVDAGSSVDVDYLAIAAHNLTGRTISLQWSDIGSTGWTTAATTAVDSNDSVVLLLTSPINKRYWRLLVSGASGMSVGVIMIGKALAVQRSINAGHSPITLSRTTVVRPAVSERGQWLGRNVIRSGLSTNIALNNLYADWYRANFDDFVKAARTEPFFFAWRPETYPDEVAFCWTTDDIAPQNVGHDRMNVSFGVDAHA